MIAKSLESQYTEYRDLCTYRNVSRRILDERHEAIVNGICELSKKHDIAYRIEELWIGGEYLRWAINCIKCAEELEELTTN